MKKSKRVGVFLAGAFLATFLGTLVGCGEPATQPDGSDGEQQEQPQDTLLVENMRTELGYSEDFKTGGAFSVTLKKADGSERVLKESEYTVDSSAVQKGVPGTYSVKVTAEGLETSYPVKVLEKQKWEEDGVLKIFMIGNSYSVDALQHVYGIAKDLGVEKIVLANLAIGGCTVERHATEFSANAPSYDFYYNDSGTWTVTQNNTPKEKLQSDDWDFITLQHGGKLQKYPETYARLPEILAKIKEWIPDSQAEIFWHSPWANQSDSNEIVFRQYYNNDQMYQYECLVKSAQEVVKGTYGIENFIPSGTAIQNARTSYIGDHMTRDGGHLDLGVGRYTAGLTLFTALTGRSAEGISWMPEEMNGNTKQRAVAVESAMNAVKTPFRITQSKYTK